MVPPSEGAAGIAPTGAVEQPAIDSGLIDNRVVGVGVRHIDTDKTGCDLAGPYVRTRQGALVPLFGNPRRPGFDGGGRHGQAMFFDIVVLHVSTCTSGS